MKEAHQFAPPLSFCILKVGKINGPSFGILGGPLLQHPLQLLITPSDLLKL